MMLAPENQQAGESAHAEMTALESRTLSAGYGNRLVLERLSLSIETGSVTSLVGPNGSGKSTVLKALARMLHPKHGAVYL
ncbi:MAG TPA: ABC transporter ATP-binding protein, partial [Ktedonobacterales bacterium]|nr:ABC transporter ATP-binding protein [Ktedonobacterales bacterium]